MNTQSFRQHESLERMVLLFLLMISTCLAQTTNEVWVPHGQVSAEIINRVLNERDDNANYYNRLRQHGDVPPGDFFRRDVARDVVYFARNAYFAPIAPVLGEPISSASATATLRQPAALARSAYEPFYPALSSLILLNHVSDETRQRLETYAAERHRVLTDLRAHLYTSPPASAATVTSLAAEQAPPLATLAESSETLRRDLTRIADFAGRSDWHNRPQWRFAGETGRERQVTEIRVLLAFAAFQDGFSQEQRHLLQEIAAEQTQLIESADKKLPATNDVLFFSPFGSRIRLPADLPTALTEKVAAYRQAKDAAKAELREAVRQQDRTWFSSKRAAGLRALADRQAPLFDQIEAAAEDIRQSLASIRQRDPESTLALPKALHERIRGYQDKKTSFQKALVTKTAEIKRALPADQVEYVRNGDGYILRVVPNPNSSREQDRVRAAISGPLTLFNQTQADAYAKLNQENAAIRADILQLPAAHPGETKGQSIDQLMNAFAAAYHRQQTTELYRDYEAAVLLPGLSPAQRDLLFGAALETLDLPLRTDSPAQL